MVIINNVQVYGLENAIKVSKYPMAADVAAIDSELTKGINALGEAERGSGHDNFLNGIVVQFDLSATVKLWTELQRYHFVDFISSQSTIHRLAQFDLDEAYHEKVDPRIIEIMKEKVAAYHAAGRHDKKEKYLELLYSNPCGMRLTAGLTTNYRQLKTIYRQRRRHLLPEWQIICDWIETLPNSNWLTKI